MLGKAGRGEGGGGGEEGEGLDVDDPGIVGFQVASFLVPKIFSGIPKRVCIG